VAELVRELPDGVEAQLLAALAQLPALDGPALVGVVLAGDVQGAADEDDVAIGPRLQHHQVVDLDADGLEVVRRR
jgi:hypothetical protein